MKLTKIQLDELLKNNPSISVDIEKLPTVVHPRSDLFFIVPGVPIPKPRQTRSDKWKQRDCVLRYREFADRVRHYISLNDLFVAGVEAVFYLPLPDSWSKKKKEAMTNQPHRQKPDIDNLIKAVLDALLPEDSMIWYIRNSKKFWSDKPRTEIKIFY